MIKKDGFKKVRLEKLFVSSPNTANSLLTMYGEEVTECISKNKNYQFFFSQTKTFDLIELEQLLQAVGWSRRPLRRVRKALDNSLLKVGLWQHDTRFPRLVGFARCTGDGIIDATVWDVAIHPVYQKLGLGKNLMSYILFNLKKMGISKVTLFADPGVVSFYKSQGWILEPKGNKCAFWYAN